ncbi:MAG: MBL fold metallo-hydrolase [Edaphobacter sp.]
MPRSSPPVQTSKKPSPASTPIPSNNSSTTHWHFDHTGGNEWVHQAGASILAHENTPRTSLQTHPRRRQLASYTFPAAPAGALPSTVFKDEHTLHANNTTLKLKHYQPAHTDSDISVYFAEADILHTADTFWNRDYPFIDYGTGGSIDGQIRAAEANIAAVTNNTIVIPGHGAVGNKADLILFRDVLVEIRDKVARPLKKQGKPLPEIIAAKPGARYDAEWGNLFQNPADFVALVYQGVLSIPIPHLSPLLLARPAQRKSLPPILSWNKRPSIRFDLKEHIWLDGELSCKGVVV